MITARPSNNSLPFFYSTAVKNIRDLSLPRLDKCLSFLFTSEVHFFLSFKKARGKRKRKEKKGRKRGLISSYKASRERARDTHENQDMAKTNGAVSKTHAQCHNLKLKLSRVYRLYFTPCYLFLSFLYHSTFTASVTCQLNMHLTVSCPSLSLSLSLSVCRDR